MKRFFLVCALVFSAVLGGSVICSAESEKEHFPYTAKPPAELDKSAILSLVKKSKLIVEGRMEVFATLDGHKASISIEKVLLGRPLRPAILFISDPDSIPTGPVILFFSDDRADGNGLFPLAKRDAPWMVNPDQEKDVIAALKSLPVDGPHYSDSVAPQDFVDVSTLTPECRDKLAAVKRDVTRHTLAASFGPDGGISLPFGYERYVMNSCPDGKRVIKLDLQFKPGEMDDTSYTRQAKPPNGPSDADTIWSVSLPYYQQPIYD